MTTGGRNWDDSWTFAQNFFAPLQRSKNADTILIYNFAKEI